MAKATHPELVCEASRRYSQFLRALVASSDDVEICRVAQSLAYTLDAAREKGGGLHLDDVTFTVTDLRGLGVHQREQLLNQFSLGFGRDDAPVIVIGTEHAYELGRDIDLVNLCVESCCGAVIWACGGNPEIVRKLSCGAVDTQRPFHIHPNDYFHEAGSHTWVRLAKVVGAGGEEKPGARPGLGDLCYQIDLSAYPRQQNHDSIPPSADRLAFLSLVLRTLSATGSVLLFHGKANDGGDRDHSRGRLARAFLGLSDDEDLQWTDLSEPHRPLKYADAGSRRVVVTRALANQGVTPDYLVRLAAVVRFETPQPSDEVATSTTTRRRTTRSNNADPLAQQRASLRSTVFESDVLDLLACQGLKVTREREGWRGSDGTIPNRYIYWPIVKGPIRCLHLGGYHADTPLTTSIDNGNVRFQLDFRGRARSEALEALQVAIRLLATNA